MLEWLEPLGRLAGWLLSIARSPLKVEVSHMTLDRVRNEPDSPVIILTLHPVRYYSSVRITNRSARPVFIREIHLCVGELTLPSDMFPVKRLEPDDYAETDIIFPVDDKRQPPEAGTFRIEVVPTRGRTARASGSFPLPSPSP